MVKVVLTETYIKMEKLKGSCPLWIGPDHINRYAIGAQLVIFPLTNRSLLSAGLLNVEHFSHGIIWLIREYDVSHPSLRMEVYLWGCNNIFKETQNVLQLFMMISLS